VAIKAFANLEKGAKVGAACRSSRIGTDAASEHPDTLLMAHRHDLAPGPREHKGGRKTPPQALVAEGDSTNGQRHTRSEDRPDHEHPGELDPRNDHPLRAEVGGQQEVRVRFTLGELKVRFPLGRVCHQLALRV